MKWAKLGPLVMAALMVSAGCIAPLTPPPGIRPDPGLLAFLEDGQTSRADVIARLGQPSTKFEADRILTYRVAGDLKGGFWIRIRGRLGPTNMGWSGVNHSLVLIFDDQGILQKQSLVPVQ